jgi:hypothetical protein
MVIEKHARDTLTAVELDVGDELRFTLSSGQVRTITVATAWAKVFHTTLAQPKVEQAGAVTNYRFGAALSIDGLKVSLVREVATQKSFYEPREVLGLTLWLDAVDDIFAFLTEEHGACRPRKRVRLAVQESQRRICPVLVHPWCPLPEGGLRVEHCYNGEDVWLGAYFGAAAHGGLDINHPAGTPIWTPLAIDDHELYNCVDRGDNNNRWRGVRHWADGSTWILQTAHLIRLRVPEHAPLDAGTHLADGAGVWVGDHEHSHFVFRVVEPGDTMEQAISLDPWILFRQMYLDRRLTSTV